MRRMICRSVQQELRKRRFGAGAIGSPPSMPEEMVAYLTDSLGLTATMFTGCWTTEGHRS